MKPTDLRTPTHGPTPYDELNGVLEEIVTMARRVLADNFVGAYLQGSFAFGAGDLASDCDFLVVTRAPVTANQELELRAFNDQLPTREGFWNRHIEGSYAPMDELKTLGGLGHDLLYIDHGWREMQWHQHCNTAVVRWILHRHGIALAGPPAKEVVNALPQGVLRATMREQIPVFSSDLLDWITDIAWDQRYAAESLCRMWFTFETDEVALKADSIHWAIGRLDARWHPLLQNTLDDRLLGFDSKQKPAQQFVEDTLDLADLISAVVLADRSGMVKTESPGSPKRNRDLRTSSDSTYVHTPSWRGNCVDGTTRSDLLSIFPNKGPCTPSLHTRLHTPITAFSLLSSWPEICRVMAPT